jgi:hypothetical protein
VRARTGCASAVGLNVARLRPLAKREAERLKIGHEAADLGKVGPGLELKASLQVPPLRALRFRPTV